MALEETVRRNDDSQYPGLVKQRFVPMETGAGTYELVAAVSNKQIQILSLAFAINVAGSYYLRSGCDNLFLFPMSTIGGIFRASGEIDLPLFCSNIGGNIQIVTTATPSLGGVYLIWREKD